MPQFTVIIPSHNDYNKAKALSTSLSQLPFAPKSIIIVSSSHNPKSEFNEFKINDSYIFETTSPRGRGVQLNHGIHFFYLKILKHLSIEVKTNHYFIFLHADSYLIKSEWIQFHTEVKNQLPRIGAFKFSTKNKGFIPNLYNSLVNLRCKIFSIPYGDQGYFICESYLKEHGLFLEIPIMEDVEWIQRKSKHPIFLSKAILFTSSDRFQKRGWIKSAFRNWKIYLKYKKGTDLHILAKHYYK